MTGLEKIKQNSNKIRAIASRHGASNVRAFGSVVRREDGPNSDMDLLVHMEAGYDLLDLIALSQELEKVLHQKMDIICDDAISPYLQERILSEAIAV